MSGYEITCSITALCSCCGKELPASSYMTESESTGSPLDRDNPYERKDRRVFITPCADCFEWKGKQAPAGIQGDGDKPSSPLGAAGPLGDEEGKDGQHGA